MLFRWHWKTQKVKFKLKIDFFCFRRNVQPWSERWIYCTVAHTIQPFMSIKRKVLKVLKVCDIFMQNRKLCHRTEFIQCQWIMFPLLFFNLSIRVCFGVFQSLAAKPPLSEVWEIQLSRTEFFKQRYGSNGIPRFNGNLLYFQDHFEQLNAANLWTLECYDRDKEHVAVLEAYHRHHSGRSLRQKISRQLLLGYEAN